MALLFGKRRKLFTLFMALLFPAKKSEEKFYACSICVSCKKIQSNSNSCGNRENSLNYLCGLKKIPF